MILLSTVDDTFTVSSRGCVLVLATEHDFSVRAFDPIQLRRPDGQTVNTHIASIEMLCGPQVHCRLALLLPKEIAGVPKGTEVWVNKEPRKELT